MAKRPDLSERNKQRAKYGGAWRTPAHNSWAQMIQRCTDPNCPDWGHYGGRGIAVCDQWRGDFLRFLEDMGDRPPGTSLDRINVNGNYEPSNCRWADTKTQQRNRRSNVRITLDGATQTISEWAELSGLERKTLEYRIRVGWDAKRAIETPSTIQRKSNGL